MSVKNEISLRVAGENGDGVFSSGETFAKICSRSGLNVHGSRSYQSIIRGGHVSYSIRAANHQVKACANYIDVLIAIRKDSFIVDTPMLTKGSIILYDSVGSRIDNPEVPEGVKLIDIPAAEIARKYSTKKIMKNTVFMGAAIGLYNLDLDIYIELIKHTFGRHGDEVVKANISAAREGFEWAKKNTEPIEHNIKIDKNAKKYYIGGNEAIAFGMLNGGLQSFAWYPMTPASPVGHFISKYGPLTGCIVKQMENEVNVANYVVGAAFAGARSATATSGGGFALMTEAIGMAGMMELPAVFIEVARGGPSTGLPTRTEQGDLNQLLGASQGDYPRAIIAQVSVEDGFYLGQEALNIAEKYQIPVLIASDLYMGEHFETIDKFDFDRIPIERGKLILDELPEDMQPYMRYKDVEDGISPRTIPGVVGGQYDAGSDEHDEYGHLISDRRAGYPEAVEARKVQMRKRMRKVEKLIDELPAPKVEGYSSDEAKVLFVGWGSTYDIIKEARETFENEGIKTAQLHIKYIVPFHGKEVGEILREYESKGVRIILVENNYTAQMGRHIRAETGFEIKEKFLSYDGEYILPRDIVNDILPKLR